MIADKPHLVLASGPQALRALLAAQGRPTAEIDAIPALRGYVPTSAGMTLAELQRMATAVGLSMRAVGHDGSATIPVPSVVHWKLGHYSAVVERVANRYRIVDIALGGSRWLDSPTLLAESSGHLLVLPTRRLTSPRWRSTNWRP